MQAEEARELGVRNTVTPTLRPAWVQIPIELA